MNQTFAYFRRDFGPWGLPTTETPGLTNMACDVNRGDVRDQRPARQKPSSYRGSSPSCARYATFSSEVLGTQAKNTRKTRSKHIKRQAGDAGQSRKVLVQSKECNAML